METQNYNLALNEQVNIVPTKAEVAAAAQNVVARVVDGYMNPLLALGKLSALEEVIKQAKDIVKPLALDEAERYERGGRDGFGAYGCEFQVKEVGVKYDYSSNEYWQQLNEAVKVAEAEKKGHEETLKRLGQCAKSSTTSVVVTLHKQ